MRDGSLALFGGSGKAEPPKKRCEQPDRQAAWRSRRMGDMPKY
jgi:hypothetical protein